LPVDQTDLVDALPDDQKGIHFTWMGHSTILVQMDGARILFDPVFSNDLSPVPWLLSIARYQDSTPVKIEDLPQMDAVFISHDHADHLDIESIKKLKEKTGVFLTALGVGDRLIEWGVDSSKVKQLDWWEEGSFISMKGDSIKFTCTPARHFSGRGLTDRN
jgi:L-ascorbate metabolism protein UlaG (beta-lactamase superfamily)